MTGSGHYEVIYNVSLLDDIHNYFPDLLYNSARFTTIADVFQYVRQRMNTRFNLFSYGASRYAANPESVIPDIIEIFSPVPITHLPRTTRFVPEDTNTLLLNVLGIGTGHAFLAREGMMRQNTQLNNFNDVVVRPNAEEIEISTEIINGAILTEETRCAVCQDIIAPADTCRKLRHCNHTYHRTCIDQWFQRSVFCPTCRHDIRQRNMGG